MARHLTEMSDSQDYEPSQLYEEGYIQEPKYSIRPKRCQSGGNFTHFFKEGGSLDSQTTETQWYLANISTDDSNKPASHCSVATQTEDFESSETTELKKKLLAAQSTLSILVARIHNLSDDINLETVFHFEEPAGMPASDAYSSAEELDPNEQSQFLIPKSRHLHSRLPVTGSRETIKCEKNPRQDGIETPPANYSGSSRSSRFMQSVRHEQMKESGIKNEPDSRDIVVRKRGRFD